MNDNEEKRKQWEIEQKDEAHQIAERLVYKLCKKHKFLFDIKDELISIAEEEHYKAFLTYDPSFGTKMSTWANPMMWQRINDECGKEAKRLSKVMTGSPLIESGKLDAKLEIDPEDELLDEESTKRIVKKNIGTIDAQIYKMRKEQNLKNKEVAKILGMSEKAVSIRYNNAKKAIEKILNS